MRGSDPLVAVVACPIVVAVAVTAMFVTAELVGFRPFAQRQFSLAEAAAEGDAPAMMRHLLTGANPLARYPVAPDVLTRDSQAPLTPLEAAALANRVRNIDLLERWGVPIDAAERVRLFCLASAARADDVVAMLGRDREMPSCAEPHTLSIAESQP